ncbi:DUF5316 family protein [Viridibacillus sp. FSL R5-0468]|uniref:DUF5316 family protein n=1 Tax=Viridibacillus sp. FSL R5-0468 TaxID=2921640 RepID=UPI0030F8D0D3
MINIFFTISVIAVLIAGLVIGAWQTVERDRRTVQNITPEDRALRMKISTYSLAVGVIYFIIVRILWYFDIK